MKEDVARLVVVESFRASASLGNLMPLLKEHLTSEEYATVSSALARCMGQIGLEVLNPLFVEHPELKEELDRRVHTYGRAF